MRYRPGLLFVLATTVSAADPALSPPELVLQLGHSNDVSSVAYAPDGATLASAGDGEVKLWDARTGELLRTLTPAESLPASFPKVAYSPDGKTLAGSVADHVAVWETATGRRLLTLSHADEVRSLAFSPDGRRLAVIVEHKVRIQAVEGDAPAQIVGQEVGSDQLAFSRDGEGLAFGRRAAVVIASVADGATRREMGGRPARPLRVLPSPDGRLLATLDTDGAARLWDASTLALLHVLVVDPGQWVDGAAFSPDSRRFAAHAHRPEVKVWDTATGRLAFTLEGHEHHTRALAYSPDGGTLATGGFTGEVKLWDAGSGRLLKTIPKAADMADRVRFVDGGKALAVAQYAQPTRVIDLATGDPVRVLAERETGDPAVDGARRRLARFLPPERRLGSALFVPYFVFSRDFRAAAVVEFGRPTRLLEAEAGSVLWTQSPDDPPVAPSFSRDGRLFSADADGLLRARDGATGRVLAAATVLPGHGEGPSTEWMAFTPEGDFHGSPAATTYLRWRTAKGLLPGTGFPDHLRPERVRERLSPRGVISRKDAPPRTD